ncbi:hypothetical protein ANCDUO_22795 [Ancylostoma duodenale]|uniref:Protein kinase domain-containing protein n=1 Tax=Ancylostoma duodenale TaxID=51022 RepID=A0A0C2FQC5_9BILA|nr:hypothetical protein ANCDUO_22795 [Ancylostoma duodenale]
MHSPTLRQRPTLQVLQKHLCLCEGLISRLFVRDVTRRATVDECLRHPWIRGPDGDDVDLRKSSCISISHIHSFKQRQRWRRAVELVMVCNRVTRSVRLAISQATKMNRTIETRYDPW